MKRTYLIGMFFFFIGIAKTGLIQDLVIFDKNTIKISEMQKARLLEAIAKTEMNLCLGGTDSLQLYSLFVEAHSILKAEF